ncbi:MAG: tripartite tricarboxylate transporter substrate binding protein [Burkholderiales bacterium]|nr:tripartite tricarboxylate transporter substrate binding protein [Burkholderiales bacterium]
MPTLITIVLAALLAPGPAAAQADPASRPITIVVPFGPGGIADLSARAVAQAMSQQLKQPVVVDNKPGAGAIVGSQAVAQAAPDGHTLLLMSNANAISASLFRKLPFDAVRDFAPVGTLGVFDLALFVAEGSKFRTVRELLADAQARPGRLTFGTIAVGSTQHLSAELFKQRTGSDIVLVPYKGTPALLTALRAGEIDAAFEILGPWLAQVQAKAVRPLALTGDRRFAALPDVPTMREAGVADYEVASWNGLAAPAKTPPAVIERLNAAANDALKTPAVADKLASLGVRAQGGTPAQMRARLERETAHWRQVITDAKIEPE